MSNLLQVSVASGTALTEWDKVTITQFELKYKHLYEVLTRNLDGVFTEYRNVSGHSVSVPLMGAFTIGDRGKYSSVVQEQEIKIGNTQIVMQAKASSVPVDIILEQEIKANILTAIAEQVAGAVKRREDQFILDALKATSDAYDNAITAAGGDITKQKAAKEENIKLIEVPKDKAFELNHIITAKVTMDKMGVPSGNRHFVAPASLQENLLLTTKMTSSDYAAVKALVVGEIKNFLSFNFHWIPDMPEGGIAENTAYAFHKDDGVQAWGLPPKVTPYFNQERLSNFVQAVVHGTAKVIVPHKMICIKYKA